MSSLHLAKILVIERDFHTLRSLRHLLVHAGYHVADAPGIEPGLEQVGDVHSLCLIVPDLSIETTKVEELFSQLRSERSEAVPPVLGLADLTLEDLPATLPVVRKPINASQLLGMVARLSKLEIEMFIGGP